MALEEQVVSWAATRPAWQRHVLRRAALGEVLSDSDYDELVETILGSEPLANDRLAVEELPQTAEGDEPVRLVSISEPDHVNALASDQPLTFALDGLTIVYGDNATGKSGYARLLKRITRARHREEVLSDVFRDTSLTEPTARVRVRVGEREEPLVWPESSMPEVKRMLFYDAECGSAYISTESDFPYRPSALFVMDRLIEACKAVRSRIDAKLLENSVNAVALPTVDGLVVDTKAGRFLTKLSRFSSIERLDALIAELDSTAETIDSLKEHEQRLKSADTSQERQRLARNAAKLDALTAHLKKIETAVSADALSELGRQRDLVRSLEEAANVLARAFDSEPLAGVGTSAWKDLWESAKRYSEAHAYPGEAFPAVGPGCRCVLCQQRFEDEGRTRLQRFDEFVKNDTQVRLVEANGTFKSSSDRVTNFAILPEAAETNLSDLEATYPELISEARSTLSRADTARTALVEALLGSGDLPGADVAFASLISRFREAAATGRREAEEVADPEATKARLAATEKRRKEIELLQSIKQDRGAIVDEINRLKNRGMLEDVKDAAAWGVITRKISELSAEEVTEVIRDRFTRETERLQLERVTIAKTRAEGTALLHKPKLVSARQDVTLPRVLSEGERTALGIAAFVTDAYLDASKSALILDDPVSSLDHIRRGLVATRLVELGADRQVIVFTHDVSFVADLKREADGKGVGVAERSVTRSRAGERKPGTCTTKHPWKAKDVPERLGELRAELARIKRECSNWEQDQYEREVAVWAGNLSETWERVFSQEVVGPVLAEGGLEVRPAMVKVLARFSDEDDKEFQASYSRVSQWVKRHDKSGKVNYVAPEVSILEEELSLVDEWFKRVKGYKN
jgi:energy-coupling factor transporter ATP-binding protein EcfA2